MKPQSHLELKGVRKHLGLWQTKGLFGYVKISLDWNGLVRIKFYTN
jgi:hypothetical protein